MYAGSGQILCHLHKGFECHRNGGLCFFSQGPCLMSMPGSCLWPPAGEGAQEPKNSSDSDLPSPQRLPPCNLPAGDLEMCLAWEHIPALSSETSSPALEGANRGAGVISAGLCRAELSVVLWPTTATVGCTTQRWSSATGA